MKKNHHKKTCVICFEPSGSKTKLGCGATILDAARQANIYVGSLCGGDGSCGKCKVTVEHGEFISESTSLLTPEEIKANVVLACQTKILSDMVVTVPKSHILQKDQILLGVPVPKAVNENYAYDPLVKKIYLEMLTPTIDDSTADHERFKAAVAAQMGIEHHSDIQMNYRLIRKLSHLLRETVYKVTVTVAHRGNIIEILRIQAGNCSDTNYGIAIDLGTTTVVAELIDLNQGTFLDTQADYNSQISFGEDYIQRIIHAEQNNSFDKMQDYIISDINNLITGLVKKNKIELDDINVIVCSGNTVMMHFLLNLDPTNIRREPYIPSATTIPPICASEVGIHINKKGLLYCLSGIASYIGADIVSGILATGMDKRQPLTLLVDIGTNGEVVLGNSDWIMCVSSSAGPAFEGSGVKHGIRAGAGAIDKLKINPDGSITYKTIGDVAPIGICGSGLLDTLAELFVNGIIDRTGRLQYGKTQKLSDGEDGLQFSLTDSADDNMQIVITQADIDNLIRSKAGIFAAIKVLLDITQKTPDDLDAIYLAGGFGNRLNVSQAVKIGLLPDIALEKIHFVGNTSIAGAKMALLSRYAEAEIEKIASAATYVDLMGNSAYMEEFIKAKFLPHTDLSLFPLNMVTL